MWKVLNFLWISSIYLVDSKMSNYFLDMDDILNEKFMPMSLVLLEGKFVENDLKNLTVDEIDAGFQCATKKLTDDGTINTAFSTMGFHRKMINEFLCSKFVAGKILDEIHPNQNQIQNRLGTPQTTHTDEVKFPTDNQSATILDHQEEGIDMKSPPVNPMLYDAGSNEYKNWLSKTTTLEDIYRHYSRNSPESQQNNRKIPPVSRQDYQVEDDYRDDYEEGEVTGYVMHQNGNNNNVGLAPGPMPGPGPVNIEYQETYFPSPTAGSKSVITELGGPTPNHPNYVFTHSPHFDPIQFQNYTVDQALNSLVGMTDGGYHYPSASDSYSYGSYGPPMIPEKKGLSLKDLFEIALTTIAFLSFGMFILQVLMCITMSKNGEGTNVMLPMEVTGEGGEAEALEVEVRMRRSIEKYSNLQEANEISKRVLKSIEALIVAKEDRGNCLKRILCENNKFSRRTVAMKQYWMPIWGLGMSWLTTKINHSPVITTLEHLQASIMGLGNGNCSKMYQCDSKVLKKRRK